MSAARRPSLPLVLLPDALAVCRLDPHAAVPAWALTSRPISVVARTADELSLIVCESVLPRDPGLELEIPMERGWRTFVVRGPLPFDLVGVFASLAQPLAEAGLSIFAFSTFDTDYVMVRAGDLQRACAALVAAGHVVTEAK